MTRSAAMLAALALPALALAADEAPARVIPAAEAKAHLGERCTVELTVKLAVHVPDRAYYLDSDADYQAPKNVAIVIAEPDVEAFRKAGIADPTVYYKGKTIRVTGLLIFQSEQVRIRVDDPKQIAVVEGKKG